MAGLEFSWRDVGKEFVNTLGDDLTLLNILTVQDTQVIAYAFNDHMNTPLVDSVVFMRPANVTEGWTRK